LILFLILVIELLAGYSTLQSLPEVFRINSSRGNRWEDHVAQINEKNYSEEGANEGKV
jgi:hypothetical protein